MYMYIIALLHYNCGIKVTLGSMFMNNTWDIKTISSINNCGQSVGSKNINGSR